MIRTAKPTQSQKFLLDSDAQPGANIAFRAGAGMVRMPDEYDKARDLREVAKLREQARRSRGLVHQISDQEGARWLKQRAEELEAKADALEAKYVLPSAALVPSGEPIAEAAALKSETALEPESTSDAPADKPEPEPA